MASKRKLTKPPAFVCLPYAMVADERCKLAHHKAAGAIASHDRLSLRKAKGQGCWASHETMAQECGLKYGTFSEAVADLLQWGYVARERRKENRRQYTYRMLKCGGDSSPKAELNSSATAEVCASPDPVSVQASSRLDSSVTPISIVRSENQERQKDQWLGYDNKKRKEDSVETGKRDSAEAASLRDAGLRKQPDNNIGGFLAMTERELKEGCPLDAQTQRVIEQIIDDFDSTDPLYGQAERILQTYGVAT